jgi:hypothetical protein
MGRSTSFVLLLPFLIAPACSPPETSSLRSGNPRPADVERPRDPSADDPEDPEDLEPLAPIDVDEPVDADTDETSPIDPTTDAGADADAGADTVASAIVDEHACIDDPIRARGQIDFGAKKNPILEYPNRAVKDLAVRYDGGAFRMLFSDIRATPNFRFRIGLLSSATLTGWSGTPQLWDDPALGGLASPDVTRFGNGEWLVTFNSHTRDVVGKLPKLYARTTRDFVTFGPARRIARSLYPTDERLIDAAVAHAPIGLILAYKRSQTFTLAHAPSGRIEGPWTVLGAPAIEGLENYQFLRIDGAWHLLGTSLAGHRPTLFRLEGDPSKPRDWLRWTKIRSLEVPQEDWNRDERANAAFLCDARAADGFWYLFYAGSSPDPRGDRFEGRGHAKIGIARSRDLVRWSVP